MSAENRRYKRIPVEIPVLVFLFDKKKKSRVSEPLDGLVKNFSPGGTALTIATIQLNGRHLFYTCQDNTDLIIELEFEINDDPKRTVIVPASPVWFDRDLDSDSVKKRFVVGLEFLISPKSQEIKSLCKVACRDEMKLVSLWKKLF